MVRFLLYTVLALYLWIGVYKSYTWVHAYGWWKKKNRDPLTLQAAPSTDANVAKLCLFIPALREQSLVKETVAYFKKFAYPAGQLAIFFITTEKEKYQKDMRAQGIKDFLQANLKEPSLQQLERTNRGLFPRDRLADVLRLIEKQQSFDSLLEQVTALYTSIPLTKDLLTVELGKLKKSGAGKEFHLIHYPSLEGNKPEQLNYALANFTQYLTEPVDDAACYIGVYDFDARPDQRTGIAVSAEVRRRQENGEKNPAMIQQAQVPFSNLAVFESKGLHGLLMRGFATLYLRRVLGIELYKMRKMMRVNQKRMPSFLKALARPVTYGIGSGMFVNLSMLRKIGGFPVPLEDLATGYRVSLLGEDIVPLSVFNMMEAYDSYSQMSNSGSLCFAGAMRIGQDYAFINSLEQNGKLTKVEKLALVAKEWIESTLWLIATPLLAVTYLVALICLPKSLALIALLVLPILIRYFFDILFLQLVLVKICSEYQGMRLQGVHVNFYQKAIIILTSPIQGLSRVLAPLKTLVRLVKVKVLKVKVVQTKTER